MQFDHLKRYHSQFDLLPIPQAVAFLSDFSEYIDVLIFLQEHAEERHLFVQIRHIDAADHERLDPVEELRGGRSLLQILHIADLVERFEGILHQFLVDIAVVHVDDLLHLLGIREFDVVEDAAPQEGIRQFLLGVGCDDYIFLNKYLYRAILVVFQKISYINLDLGEIKIVDIFKLIFILSNEQIIIFFN